MSKSPGNGTTHLGGESHRFADASYDALARQKQAELIVNEVIEELEDHDALLADWKLLIDADSPEEDDVASAPETSPSTLVVHSDPQAAEGALSEESSTRATAQSFRRELPIAAADSETADVQHPYLSPSGPEVFGVLEAIRVGEELRRLTFLDDGVDVYIDLEAAANAQILEVGSKTYLLKRVSDFRFHVVGLSPADALHAYHDVQQRSARAPYVSTAT